ncbi:MAG: hypothetical protein K8F91_00395 [Candidatus Obscuribacterales bacterium]|nr:hypothetical protein [Candidatus Obscuribacterales bacterium]
MTIYPVVREADGNQYLITPSGKQVTVPGLGIAGNATQVSVYRDQSNHFWYTDMNGKQVAVTPEQLEAAQAQINAQSGGGAMQPQMMPPTQSYYSSTPSYAVGFNGIPYGTPIRMEAPGQYSYMAPGGNKQFVNPTPQTSAQLNQWQQQVPFGQQPNLGSMQGGQQQMQGGSQQMQGAQQMQGSAQQHSGDSRMDKRRERRAERLEDRSKNQASNASNDQSAADSKVQSGQALGAGFSARRAAREERRAKREDRRADFLNGN